MGLVVYVPFAPCAVYVHPCPRQYAPLVCRNCSRVRYRAGGSPLASPLKGPANPAMAAGHKGQHAAGLGVCGF